MSLGMKWNGSLTTFSITEVLVLRTPGMERMLFTTLENSSRSRQATHAMQSKSPVTSKTETTWSISMMSLSTWIMSPST